jgi:hypothetical protein
MKASKFSTEANLVESVVKLPLESLKIYTYKPKIKQVTGLLFLFDGVYRDAVGICRKAISIAEQTGLMLVAPVMQQKNYPKWRYQYAGIIRNNRIQNRKKWTINTIQSLIDHMLEDSLGEVKKVILFGHSAGGQLLSRISAYSTLSDVNSIIIANPSSYVMPFLDEDAPYGFQGIYPNKKAQIMIKRYLSAPIIIYLGAQDLDDLHLSQSKASIRQGKNRLERGRRVYHIGRQLAELNHYRFNWQLIENPIAGHSSREMINSDIFKRLLLNIEG